MSRDPRTDGSGAEAPQDDAAPPEPDAAPARDEDIADPDQFFVPRDGQGQIREVRTDVEGFGDVIILPMKYGQGEEYFGDAGGVASVGPKTIAEVLRNHVIEPDLNAYAKAKFDSGEWNIEAMRAATRDDPTANLGPDVYLTGYVVKEEMTPFAPMQLLTAVLTESGLNANVEMGDDGTAEVEFDEQGN